MLKMAIAKWFEMFVLKKLWLVKCAMFESKVLGWKYEPLVLCHGKFNSFDTPF